VSRRAAIRMTDEEALAFLDEQRTVICATHGHDGWPHLMPLWYVLRDGEVWAWTYAKSQKVRNLERDPRCTLQVEAGIEYAELRGVMLECDVEIEREPERVADFGLAIFERYTPGAELPEGTRAMVLAQAVKRVGLAFTPTRTASWDHRKLEGVY
jgi:PPOX class probable F420-dependent enzyme